MYQITISDRMGWQDLIAQLVKRVGGKSKSGGIFLAETQDDSVALLAEYKYDGHRALIHHLPDGQVGFGFVLSSSRTSLENERLVCPLL